MINSATKPEKDYAEEFFNAFTKHIEKENNKERHPSFNITPSGLKCLRAIVYRLSGVKTDGFTPSYSLCGITESGSNRHEVNQGYIDSMETCNFIDVGKYVKEHKLPLEVGEKKDFESPYETHLYDRKNHISFLVDGIIEFSGKTFILEIKTMVQTKFWKIKDDVPDEYKLQATCYSLLLGIPQVMFLFEDRNILTKKCLVYTPTEEEKNNMRDLIASCNDYVNKKIVPAKPVVDRKVCSYCDYKKTCSKSVKAYSSEEDEKYSE